MVITAIIVDDEENARVNLRRMLERYCPQVKLIGEASNQQAALDLILRQAPDLIFLDVEMPGGSGFDLVEALSPLEMDLIFVTAFNKYAERAFEVAALHYLTKPLDPVRLTEAVKRYVNKHDRAQTLQQLEVLLSNHKRKAITQMCLPTLTGLDIIWLEQILRLEAEGNYTHFHFVDQPAKLVTQKLKFYELQLPEKQFFRCHNSFIINRQHVQKYHHRGKGGYVKMVDGFEVAVSVRKKESFLDWLKNP